MADYSILLRDRISAAEWQEDVTRLEQTCLQDAELQRLSTQLKECHAARYKVATRPRIRIPFLCCISVRVGSVVNTHRNVQQASVALRERQNLILETWLAQLMAKYGDRSVAFKVDTGMGMGAVSMGTVYVQTLRWVTIEMAEVEGEEKAAIRARAGKGSEQAQARAAAGIVLPVVIPPVGVNQVFVNQG